MYDISLSADTSFENLYLGAFWTCMSGECIFDVFFFWRQVYDNIDEDVYLSVAEFVVI